MRRILTNRPSHLSIQESGEGAEFSQLELAQASERRGGQKDWLAGWLITPSQ
jgi:hypothetical protein